MQLKKQMEEKPREEKANKRQPSPSQHSRRNILAHMDAPMTFKWDQSFASGVTCPEHLVIHVVTQERLLRLSSASPLSPPLLGPFPCQWCVPSSGKSTWMAWPSRFFFLLDRSTQKDLYITSLFIRLGLLIFSPRGTPRTVKTMCLEEFSWA